MRLSRRKFYEQLMQCDHKHEFSEICKKFGGAALGGAQMVLRNNDHMKVNTLDDFLCEFLKLYPNEVEKLCYGSTWLRNPYIETESGLGVYRLIVELDGDEDISNGFVHTDANEKLFAAVAKMASMAATSEFAERWLANKHHPCCTGKDGNNVACDCGLSDFITAMRFIENHRIQPSVPETKTPPTTNTLSGIDVE